MVDDTNVIRCCFVYTETNVLSLFLTLCTVSVKSWVFVVSGHRIEIVVSLSHYDVSYARTMSDRCKNCLRPLYTVTRESIRTFTAENCSQYIVCIVPSFLKFRSRTVTTIVIVLVKFVNLYRSYEKFIGNIHSVKNEYTA